MNIGIQPHAPGCSPLNQRGASQADDQQRQVLALPPQVVDQVERTVAGVAGYGGSLDVIIDDAE